MHISEKHKYNSDKFDRKRVARQLSICGQVTEDVTHLCGITAKFFLTTAVLPYVLSPYSGNYCGFPAVPIPVQLSNQM
jgi:hypothetical protein